METVAIGREHGSTGNQGEQVGFTAKKQGECWMEKMKGKTSEAGGPQ